MKRMFTRAALAVFFILISVNIAFAGSQQTSSTLASTVITNARYYLHDPDDNFWTDTELLVWVNDGILDIVKRTHCLETTQTVTLSSNTRAYSITEDYLKIKHAIWWDSGKSQFKALLPGNPNDVGSENREEPKWFYDWDNYIEIWPTASSDHNSSTVTVLLVSTPSTVTASDYVPVPTIYDRALLYYVVAQAWMKGNYGLIAAEKYESKYIDELERLRKDFIEMPMRGN